MVTARSATAADILTYYGEPCQHTMNAVVLEKDGALVGVIGSFHALGRRILFSDYTSALGEDINSFVVRRAVIQQLRLAIASKLPVFSVKEEGSDVLERLGFERASGDLYRWPEQGSSNA